MGGSEGGWRTWSKGGVREGGGGEEWWEGEGARVKEKSLVCRAIHLLPPRLPELVCGPRRRSSRTGDGGRKGGG